MSDLDDGAKHPASLHANDTQPMIDQVSNWFYHHVVAGYDVYAQERENESAGRYQHRRAAIEAATALFHFREHLPAPHMMTKQAVEKICPEFSLIADVANAAKHNVLTQGDPSISSVGDIEERAILTRYADADGEYSDARTRLFVKRKNGSQAALDPAITAVLNFWSFKLRELNITDYPSRPFPVVPGSQFVPRSEAKGLNLNALRSIGLSQSFALQRYNMEKGGPEAIDLTDADVKFRVYRPSYSFDITVTPPNFDTPFVVSFALTAKESDQWHGLQSDEEREQFYSEFVKSRREEINLRVSEAIAESRDRPST